MVDHQRPEEPALDERTRDFYRQLLEVLRNREIKFMVAGSYAAGHYTGRTPHTKDLDIFLPPSQVEGALAALTCSGISTERPFPFWLAKARQGNDFVDLISRAASGLWDVEEEWLANAMPADMWGVDVLVCGIEELIWSKVGIMDRERYDGNDVLHLLLAQAADLDWDRLRHLAGSDWRLLLAHLTLFGYVYPDRLTHVPRHLLAEMSLHLLSEYMHPGPDVEPVCRGTLISNTQFREDIDEGGYHDARLRPWGRLEPADLEAWDAAVERGDT